MTRTIATSLWALGMLGWAGAAQAQDATDTEADAETSNMIIVTGEKVERSLQDTVASVAVMSLEQLEEENIVDLGGVFSRMANVTESYPGAGFSIRGISNRNVSGGGASGLATVFVDGAALPDAYITGTGSDMWDVAQVEVLRGPQSTLQGRNTLAGAVVISTRKPTFDWTARGEAQYSSYNTQRYAFAGGGPLIADQLAFRVAGEYRSTDGFVKNVTRDTDENARETVTGRARLLFTPTALPDLTAEASYTHTEYDGGYLYSYSRADVADPYDDRIDLSDEPNLFSRNSELASLNLGYALSGPLSLSSITAWSHDVTAGNYDGDYTAEPITRGSSGEIYETFSQELRLDYSGSRFTGLLGLYYSNRKRDFTDTSLTNVTTPTGTIAALLQSNGLDAATAGSLAELYTAALPLIPVDFWGKGLFKTRNYAIFTDGRFEVTPKFELLYGLRYDREEFIQTAVTTTDFVGTYPDPADFGAPGSQMHALISGINAGVAQLVAAAEGETLDKTPRKFEAWLPKFGLNCHWTDDISTGLLVQRGYRSGGSTYNQARAIVVPYDAEYTWNYEASLRTAWLDEALTVNANAYYTDWKDQQVTVYFGTSEFDYHTVNAGKSHLYGFELEAAYRPAGGLSLYGSVGHSVTRFDDFTLESGVLGSDIEGSEFPFAPHWTMSGGVHYDASNGLSIDVNGNYRSSQFSAVDANQEDGKVGGRTVINAVVGYDADPWRISVFVNNLFDAEYFDFLQVISDRAMVGAPRTVGIRAGFDF